MKKLLSVILSVVLILSCVVIAFAGAGNEIVLSENGVTQYKIVISKNATNTEKNAAKSLSEHLERISSAEFETVTDDTASTDKEIVIGVTNRDSEININRDEFDQDGVRIVTSGDKLFLTGGEERGALYAVFTFLEDYLGCRWFTKELTVVPETDILTISPIDYTFVPPFKLRQTYWMFSTMYADYCVEHKLHSYMAYIPSDWGGSPAEYNINSVHTLQWIITRDMFEEHPEYFGCDSEGNRSVNRQPCFSNEDVFELVVNNAKSFFSQYNTIYSISQNDGMSFCQCDDCTAFNKAHGGTDSASLINFVNRVALAVREDYPNAQFETLAYQESLIPPENLELLDGIVIRMCPLNGCVLHDFDDSSCPSNKKFNDALKGWAQLTDSIYMWNYSTNFQYYYALFPNITTLQSRYKYFRDNNVIAIFDNGCGENMASGEFHELKTYLVAKLLWNPDTDIDRHITEFCYAYYGAAGEDVKEFIYQFEDLVKGYKPLAAANCHMTCQDGGESLEHNTALTESEIKKLDKIMANALSKDLSEEAAHNLQGVSIGWRFFKCGTFAGEFNWLSYKNDPIKETEQLYLDMKEYGITFLSEGGGVPFSDNMPNCTVRPTWWFADESQMPNTVKFESKILPFINKILRIIFWFTNINKE